MATYQFGPQQGEIDGRVDEVWAGRLGTTPPNRFAHQLLEQQLAVFFADRRKVLEDLICRGDGVDQLRSSWTRSMADSCLISPLLVDGTATEAFQELGQQLGWLGVVALAATALAVVLLLVQVVVVARQFLGRRVRTVEGTTKATDSRRDHADGQSPVISSVRLMVQLTLTQRFASDEETESHRRFLADVRPRFVSRSLGALGGISMAGGVCIIHFLRVPSTQVEAAVSLLVSAIHQHGLQERAVVVRQQDAAEGGQSADCRPIWPEGYQGRYFRF